ncbi:MAG: ComEC/Rec2 family competence protein, partial [Chloroflexota bacterium]
RGAKERTIHGLTLVTAQRYGEFDYGDQIRIQGEPITPPNFDTFSYQEYLARSGVYSFIPYSKLTLLEHGHGNPIFMTLFDIRNRSRQLIQQILPSPQSALLTGILLGSDNDIPPEISDAFNQTGTTHIIAISGSNITIVAGLLLAVFGRLGDKRLAAIFMLAGIAIYTIFVGASPSVVRAAIMGSLSIIALRLGRRSDGLTALAASIWVMTLLNPLVLFDMGLILSASATLGLILYSEPLTALSGRFFGKLFTENTAKQVVAVFADAVLITLAAQITTLPIIFLVFERFSAVSFLTNILVIPAQAPIMTFGILSLVTGAVWFPAGQLFGWLVGIPVAYTLAVIRAMAQWPGASVPIVLEPGVIILYYTLLFGGTIVLNQSAETRQSLFVRLRSAVTTSTIAILGLGIAAILWAIVLSRPDGKLHVWFLAVGQGNAVLIQSPQGAHILVDGGENPTQLRTALGDRLPFYKRDLDVLFITQPAKGTIAALPPLFERYTARTVITNGQSADGDTYQALNRALDRSQMPVVAALAGYKVHTDDGIMIEVLSPTQFPAQTDKPGDAPLILRLTYGDASFLLSSDLTEKGVKTLLASQRISASTVLQLASNGGEKQNPDMWIGAVAPQVAVVEAEKGGKIMPADSVLKRLGDMPIFRTDSRGTVEIATDGKQLWISTNH